MAEGLQEGDLILGHIGAGKEGVGQVGADLAQIFLIPAFGEIIGDFSAFSQIRQFRLDGGETAGMDDIVFTDVLQIISAELEPEQPLTGAFGAFYKDPVTIGVDVDTGLAGLDHDGTAHGVVYAFFVQTVLDMEGVDIISENAQIADLFGTCLLYTSDAADE